MSQSYEFYSERARESEAAAEEATLHNVRERAERAAKTWHALAAQAKSVAATRERVEREKAEERAAEAARVGEMQASGA
ncbi:hypothetical protein GRI58_13180 [Porphyrobacter algicida]|uniref:Uncharacterized protein n=1 Tax=Qipengyuania algicida TaxID=1836209 RepID=A0A845ALJ6_9SPHN|nr:hypothetical protein [Qipengyuania algicida]MXP29761.1 hypothetical protein [Qipengyuania algicida]